MPFKWFYARLSLKVSRSDNARFFLVMAHGEFSNLIRQSKTSLIEPRTLHCIELTYMYSTGGYSMNMIRVQSPAKVEGNDDDEPTYFHLAAGPVDVACTSLLQNRRASLESPRLVRRISPYAKPVFLWSTLRRSWKHPRRYLTFFATNLLFLVTSMQRILA